MYTVILISDEKILPPAMLKESIRGEPAAEDTRLLVCDSVANLYPAVFFEKPLVMLIHGRTVQEDLGAVSVLKNTFPYLKVLLIVPAEMRSLAARSIAAGVDAYILEPYFIDELFHFVRQAYRRALEELERSMESRMATLYPFSEGLSHEINNRLAAISSALQYLMGRSGESLNEKDRQETYRLLKKEESRLEYTIRELENFARPPRAKKNTVSLRAVVQMAVEDAVKNSASDAPVHSTVHAETEMILVDQRLLVSALSALIRFLRENPAGEKCMIEIEVSAPEEGRVRIVIDGINTLSLGEDVKNAFIPLYPYMKAATHFGPGPGPASAYGFIKAHGGVVDAETTPFGTRFKIDIPLVRIGPDGI